MKQIFEIDAPSKIETYELLAWLEELLGKGMVYSVRELVKDV